MLRLKTVGPDDRTLLWNINQKYLYEMTNFYDNPMDAEGNIHYGYFDAYFTDPRRKAYLIYCGDGLAGFAMLCPYSNIGRTPDCTMAEFTVFPAYRRRHIAREAAKMIFSLHPGVWEIKYNEKNTAAKALWNRAAAPYDPETVHINDVETVLTFRIP